MATFVINIFGCSCCTRRDPLEMLLSTQKHNKNTFLKSKRRMLVLVKKLCETHVCDTHQFYEKKWAPHTLSCVGHSCKNNGRSQVNIVVTTHITWRAVVLATVANTR